jgi:hypothetical protein
MSNQELDLFIQETDDISVFRNFAIPSRRMTDAEKAEYRRLASDWAKLDAIAQRTLYAAFIAGRIARYARNVFRRTLKETYDEPHGLKHPKAIALMEGFDDKSVPQDAQFLLGFKLTAARNIDKILAGEQAENVEHQNFWYRILGLAS